MCLLNNVGLGRVGCGFENLNPRRSRLHTLKKIGALLNPKNGKNSFDGATKPKKVFSPGTNSKPFVRDLLDSLVRNLVPHTKYETFEVL
jgi:hypothetical protein